MTRNWPFLKSFGLKKKRGKQQTRFSRKAFILKRHREFGCGLTRPERKTIDCFDISLSEKKAIMKLFRTIASQSTPEEMSTTHVRPAKPPHMSTMNSAAMKAKEVKWDDRHRRFPVVTRARKHGDLNCVAHQRRTEFDIAPDWRAPMRSVIPMTQISRARCAPTQGRLPRLSKHVCLHGQREFVIHPEWIIH